MAKTSRSSFTALRLALRAQWRSENVKLELHRPSLTLDTPPFTDKLSHSVKTGCWARMNLARAGWF